MMLVELWRWSWVDRYTTLICIGLPPVTSPVDCRSITCLSDQSTSFAFLVCHRCRQQYQRIISAATSTQRATLHIIIASLVLTSTDNNNKQRPTRAVKGNIKRQTNNVMTPLNIAAALFFVLNAWTAVDDMTDMVDDIGDNVNSWTPWETEETPSGLWRRGVEFEILEEWVREHRGEGGCSGASVRSLTDDIESQPGPVEYR